jgi:hypothetical protein
MCFCGKVLKPVLSLFSPSVCLKLLKSWFPFPWLKLSTGLQLEGVKSNLITSDIFFIKFTEFWFDMVLQLP